MKVAVPFWNNRVAPVFDAADQWLSVSVTESRWHIDQEITFTSSIMEKKVQELLENKVEYLLCGAIPYRYERFLKSAGCEVFSFVAGKPEDVIQAWINDRINDSCFYMPGCRQRSERRSDR